MNSKMTANSQLSITETKNRKTMQASRTETESQKWRSHGGLSERRDRGVNMGKVTEKKKHNWQVQSRQREVKNSIRNEEAKELICTTHGHELRGGGDAGGNGVLDKGG